MVRLAPLVAIDLIIRNAAAKSCSVCATTSHKGCYFVPGGMILKNERLRDAFARILKTETNFTAAIEDARLLGAYEHFYANNRFGEAGYGTHYVVLGHELRIDDIAALKPDNQHSELRWWTEADLLASPDVHHNTKAYFHKP